MKYVISAALTYLFGLLLALAFTDAACAQPIDFTLVGTFPSTNPIDPGKRFSLTWSEPPVVQSGGLTEQEIESPNPNATYEVGGVVQYTNGGISLVNRGGFGDIGFHIDGFTLTNHPTLYSFNNLNSVTWNTFEPTAVVGYSGDQTITFPMILSAIPVPEPAAWALFSVGIGVLVVVKWGRGKSRKTCMHHGKLL